ncbi:hypothetical protein BD779DRAFT_1802910 [Infundibulicybe gibba]|nr:hypothetical protein BD779DRAFT_1802910 [Infundibulicybe gibba]
MCVGRRTMELGLDIARPIDNFDLDASPTTVRKNDFVRWQGSQSSALDTLRKETSCHSPRKSKARSTSLSTSPTKTLSRISKRTSSRLRSSRRPGPPNSDALILAMQDPGGFINQVKNVSKLVNKTVDTRTGKPNSNGAAHAEGEGPSASGVKRITRNVGLGSSYHGRPTGKSRDIAQQDARCGKGKEREVNTRRSLPSTSKSLPSVDLADTGPQTDYDQKLMDIDAPTTASSSRTRPVSPAEASGDISMMTMPPPRSIPRSHIAAESAKGDLNLQLSTTSPKLHPLLQHQAQRPPKPSVPQQQSRQPPSAVYPHHNSQVQPQPQSSTQIPSHTHPTQSTRPPALGMRRAHTLPTSTPQPQANTVPTKQKGFKPPLLSQSQPGNHSQVATQNAKATSSGSSYQVARAQNTHVPPLPHESQHVQSRTEQPEHCRSGSASPPPGPDDSFGNISFGMDVDVLEDFLKLYD